MSACAYTTLGRVNEDEGMVQRGTQLYARALAETNRALRDPVRVTSDETLACCRVLGLFEHLRKDTANRISSQGGDWQSHVEGSCRIVEVRGPERHVNDHGHALFEDLRLNAVIAAIIRRKPDFFTSDSWRSVPWQAVPRNLWDELVDSMLEIPRLLQSIDQVSETLVAPKADIESRILEIVAECVVLGNGLRDWEGKALRLANEQQSLEQANAERPKTLREVCKNHGYGFFHVSMLYWTASLLVYSNAWLLYRRVTKASDLLSISTADLRLPAWMNPETAAANIANCAAHYYRPEAGYWGPQSASFCAGAALHYYALTKQQDTPEFAKITVLFRTNALGKATGDFLRSIAADAVPESAKGDCAIRPQHRQMAGSWYGMDRYEQKQTPSPFKT